jgi:hypothetical protein
LGTNGIEKAMADAYPKPITTIRSVELHHNLVLGILGGHCLVVHGETGPVKKAQQDDPLKRGNLASRYYSK